MASNYYYPTSKNGIQKTLAAQLLNTASTGDAITFSDVDGVENKPGVLVINRVDANGADTPSAREFISYSGTSGNTVLIETRNVDGSGATRTHAVNSIVEFVADGVWGQRVIDQALVAHEVTGVHKSGIALPSPVITTPQINDTSSDHQYILGVSELTADRTITLPLLTGNDDFVFEDHTQTLTNKTLSTGVALNASASENFTYHSLARQAIINGNFDVWQRGTSVALTAADGYTSDRWYVETVTAGTDKTVSRQDGTGVNGSYYCARVAMVADVDETLRFSQALESQDSIKFRGKKLTLSFYARGGAEFVADNATLISKIVTGKGTDQKVLAFTTSADAVSQNNTLTTSWVKFTCTTSAVIASDITQIGVMFAFTHAGSGTATNYFEVTQVQLCAGDVALPFQPKSYVQELADCERYTFVPDASSQIPLGSGFGISTTVARIYIPTPTTMRAAKAITATAGDWQLYDGVTGFDLTAIAIEGAGSGGNFVSLSCTVAAGLTQFRPYYLTPDASVPRTLVISSEL